MIMAPINKSSLSCGWHWVVLFSCFFIKLLNAGLRKSFGVLLLPLQNHFDQDVWMVGMIVSISLSVGDFTGPMVGGLSKRVGCRVVVILGGIFLCCGLIMASLAKNIIQLAIFLCVNIGVGFGFANDVPFAVLGRYYQRNFSLANGFAMTGTAFGYMLIGPLTAYLIDLYGWRGTLLLLGAIVFHISAFGAVLYDPTEQDTLLNKTKTRNYKTTETTTTTTTTTTPIEETQENALKRCWKFVSQSLDTTLFKEPIFISFIIVTTITRLIQIAWLIYLVPNVISKGVSNLRASLISTTAGIGGGIGQLLPGLITIITDDYLSSRTLLTVGMAITSISLFLDAIITSYAGMLTLGACQGLGLGIMYTTCNVVLYDEFGKERLVNAMGWIRGVSGIGRAIGGFLPGWIYQTTSSYHWSYVILGAIQALAIIILYIGRIRSHCLCTSK